MAFAALTPVARFKLRRPGLAQVLCQLRFSPILRLRQDDAVIPFQEAVRDAYPRYMKQEGVGILITPGGVQQQQTQPGLHRFQDTSNSFTVTLAPDFVALETVAYVDIDDFAARLLLLVDVIQELYAPAEIGRLGLRFVNELRLPPGDVEGELLRALNPALLGLPGAVEFVGAVKASEQVIELVDGDRTILVRHGLQPHGTTVMTAPGQEPPQQGVLAQPFYLLDVDAFVQQPVPFSVEGVGASLHEFNDDVRALFAWSVTEAYRRDTLGQDDDV